MGAIRKFKVNTKKKESFVQRNVICIGQNQDKEPVFMNARTFDILNKNYNSLLSKLYKEYQLPKKLKNPVLFNREEKELFKLVGNVEDNTYFTIYDTTDIKYTEAYRELEVMKLVADVLCCFDMDALVEDENGNEITHWERWKLPKNDWFRLLKFVINEEDGLGFNLSNINLINSELLRMKMNEPTIAENILNGDSLVDERISLLDKFANDLEDMQKEEEKEDELYESESTGE